MNIKFLTLTLQCRQSREVINFSKQISFFHGKISSGKSSIVRLIDFCLGGTYENTPALQHELVSVSLVAEIGENIVLFEREPGSNNVQITWKKNEKIIGSVLAPVDKNDKPIWENSIFNISDLIFYLLKITPLKVRRSKMNTDSPLIRLSFKDIRWYCYLEQAHLDSSFYNLEIPYKNYKSRDVMRFVVGYYNEKLNNYEIELEEYKEKQQGLLEAINQIKLFLKEYEYNSEHQLEQVISQNKIELENLTKSINSIQENHNTKTHFVDDLREELRKLNNDLQNEEETLSDIQYYLEQEKSLASEILSTKFKLAKTSEASSILSGVNFEVCPNCGSKIKQEEANSNVCLLCKNPKHQQISSIAEQTEIMRKDLTSRLNEIEESIERRSWALRRQQNTVEKIKQKKLITDRKMKEELFKYDSLFLSQAREMERKAARLDERSNNLNQIQSIFKKSKKLQEESDKIDVQIAAKKRLIDEEKENLTNSLENIKKIEDLYLEYLNLVGVPGITIKDKIKINLKTWEPSIYPEGDESLSYSFYNAGSGGKKTLINVCYALAIHSIASQNNLPLPTFLIIDTPMKNIGEDVNKDIFENFYQLLYKLAANELRNTQFIIIDKEYISPENPVNLDIFERYMTPNDPDYPPLISYYRGP